MELTIVYMRYSPLIYFLTIAFVVFSSCTSERTFNPNYYNTDYNLSVFGPYDIGEINDSLVESKNYFGPSNIMKYSGYFFYLAKIENSTEDTMDVIFNTDSLGVINRLDFSKCDDRKSYFCAFSFNKFDHPDKIKIALSPSQKCVFLVPLAPVSFPLESLLISRNLGIPSFYTCFFPELESFDFYKKFNPEKPQCDACYFRNNGISIGNKIPISTIITSCSDDVVTGLKDIPSCNQLQSVYTRIYHSTEKLKFYNYFEGGSRQDNIDSLFSKLDDIPPMFDEYYRAKQKSYLDSKHKQRIEEFDSIFHNCLVD